MKTKRPFDSMSELSSWFVLVILVLSALLIPAGPATAGVLQEWVARYNGPGNFDDVASAIAVDKDGNVYVTGFSTGADTSTDYATIKYGPNGHQLWVARYNGPGNLDDRANAIAVDKNGNVYVTGVSSGSGTDSDYATIKYDPNGNELWVARYNGPGNFYDSATAVAVDGSGNVYVTGQSWGSGTESDYATIKYDPNGNELWVARYNGPGNNDDRANAIAIDKDGNVYATGASIGSDFFYNYATIKYDPNGNELWAVRYGVPGNNAEATAIALDRGGNIYVTGGSFTSSTFSDYATVKYDPNGNELWVARYNGPANAFDTAEAMAVDAGGNVYVTGFSEGSGTSFDYATIKYDPNGNKLWVARYDGPGSYVDNASAIAVDRIGNVYVTGYSWGSSTSFDYATIKYDPNGNKLWAARYNGPSNNDDWANAIAIDKDGNVYVTGFSTRADTSTDYATIKYKQIADFAGLIQLIDSLLTQGAIAGQLQNSLLAKVENAQTSYDKGNVCTAINQLNSVKNQIEGQSGKKISDAATEQLLAYINDLITQLLSTLPAGESC